MPTNASWHWESFRPFVQIHHEQSFRSILSIPTIEELRKEQELTTRTWLFLPMKYHIHQRAISSSRLYSSTCQCCSIAHSKIERYLSESAQDNVVWQYGGLLCTSFHVCLGFVYLSPYSLMIDVKFFQWTSNLTRSSLHILKPELCFCYLTIVYRDFGSLNHLLIIY